MATSQLTVRHTGQVVFTDAASALARLRTDQISCTLKSKGQSGPKCAQPVHVVFVAPITAGGIDGYLTPDRTALFSHT